MRRFLWIFAILAVGLTSFRASGQAKKDSPGAASTRKKLKAKISVDYKDTRLKDIASDIQKQLDNKVSIKLDTDGGVSNNLTLTYSADDKPVETMLDEMFAKNQLGYVIVSNPKDRRDGFIIFKKGKQRGYEAGEEPGEKPAAKDKAKSENKPDKDGDEPVKPKKDKAVKDKASKDKPAKDKATKDKASKDKPDKDGGDDDGDKAEVRAAAKLSLAKMLYKDGLVKKAVERFNDIIKEYPKTKAADKARAILKKLEE